MTALLVGIFSGLAVLITSVLQVSTTVVDLDYFSPSSKYNCGRS